MRIGIVTHKIGKGDGQGRVNYEVVKAALGKGYNVVAFSTEIDDDLLRNMNLKWYKISRSKMPTALIKYQIFAIKSYFEIKKHKREFDILIVNGFITYHKSDINVVHFVHSSWINSIVHPSKGNNGLWGKYQWLYSYINSKLELFSFKKTKVIVPVSLKVQNEITDAMKENSKKVRFETIYNGVDTIEFSPSSNNSIEMVLKNRENVIGFFAGDLKTNRKNLDTILNSMVNIDNFKLLVAGDTNSSPFPKMTKMLGIEEKVEFLGFRRDIAELMKEADFFVFPSRYEACSLVVLEALSSGLPVITTYQSGLGEIIIANEAGIIINDSEDIHALENALKSYVDNIDLRNLHSKNARKLAELNKWSEMGSRYLKLIESL